MKVLNTKERKAIGGGFIIVTVTQFPGANSGIPRSMLETLGMTGDVLGYSSTETCFKDLAAVAKPLSSPALMGIPTVTYRMPH